MRKNGCIVLAAFLIGIFLANLSEKELMTSYGILNTYFLGQYSYRVINYDSLFCHILFERLKAAVLLLLLGKVLEPKWFLTLVESTAALILGFLMSAAIANLGIKGILVTSMGLFPQWIFYLSALFTYALYLKENNYALTGGGNGIKIISVHMGVLLILCLLMFAGMITESYLNPVILKKILKFL